ncbi:hypothetical protein GCM10009760_42670 [Kitasatospora kazusensis]|uniref:UPF0102 protein GCM10009760_42670 n=1 Tax=Kitasatospora kazusensis TaxID=407974 RepID=A0ABN2ZX73_9ACTN
MTVQSSNNGLGRYGEEVAARWLAAGGLRVLERNWRCSEGELDIVALDGDTLAVCEVKTRSERGFQQPSEGIDRAKADRLRRLAERWLGERWPTHFARLAGLADAGRVGPAGLRATGSAAAGSTPAGPDLGASGPAGPGAADPDLGTPSGWTVPTPPGGVRIDLIGVVNRRKGPAEVEHLRGAV